MHRAIVRPPLSALMLALLALAIALVVPQRPAVQAAGRAPTYTNPLPVTIPNGGLVESCADPAIIRSQAPGDTAWYMYCTTDPLNGQDRNAEGKFNFHLMPILKSADLVNWTYVGDAFTTRPGWVADNAGLWAPNVEFFDGTYYLYYTASGTDLPGGGSAIGVATSTSPTGPWTDAGAPVVEPHQADCCPGSRRWTFDADVIEAGGLKYIYYGSYFGGISVRNLSADGLRSDPATQQAVALDNRYEGANVVKRGDYYYLFASATDCCRGPLTGYSIFAGRSTSPQGPFLDKEGVSLLAGRVGGTPVISMNGNRWVGPGHSMVFSDFAGQDWLVYHAIDRTDPYFTGATGFTKRPVLLDALDWVDGWPTVRGGLWASSTPQLAPAAQPGDRELYRTRLARPDVPGAKIAALSDEFNGQILGSQWTWVREPAAGVAMTGKSFGFDTQAADLHVDSNNASVLTGATPTGDYVVDTRVKLNLPAEGCCFNYVQAGLVIYDGDDNYLKLTHVSIWNSRQTEFAKELGPVPADYPRYGNTVVTAPDEWTYLRIAKRTVDSGELYTAYISRDGQTWNRGGTWTHQLGADARIGLVSMGGSGFTANFDYVRVYQLQD